MKLAITLLSALVLLAAGAPSERRVGSGEIRQIYNPNQTIVTPQQNEAYMQYIVCLNDCKADPMVCKPDCQAQYDERMKYLG